MESSAEKIRVVQYGLGMIGSAIARYVLNRAELELVGCVDVDPSKCGADAGHVIGLDKSLGFSVSPKLDQVLSATDADIAIHATSSRFETFKAQIMEMLDAGLNVVSTAEELSFPWLAHPAEAAEIDDLARRVGKTVMATGINPGFIMDSLPLNLTAICQEVKRIEVTRVIDASKRRRSFQEKIGSGMTVEDFQARMAAGSLGHVGLIESAGMVFDTLGRKLSRHESRVDPIISESIIRTEHFEVSPGRVRGLREVARIYDSTTEFMTLTFQAALEEADEGDTIRIYGRPDLEVRIKGTNGDVSTVAISVNAARRVVRERPGLLTMRDLCMLTI